jgi:hypothetical protein
MGSDLHSHRSHPITAQMLHCIQECTSCHAVCVHTMTVAVFTDPFWQDDGLIRALQDCAEISHTGADFLLRGSPLHGLTCEACAQICEACVSMCEKYPKNENMRACAESCRSCASACHAIAASAPDWRDVFSES